MAELQPCPWHPPSASPDVVQRSIRMHRSIWYVRLELDDLGLAGRSRLAAPATRLYRADGARRSRARRYRNTPFGYPRYLRGFLRPRSVDGACSIPSIGKICLAEGGLTSHRSPHFS